MKSFDIEEALHQWSRLKRELSGEPFFSLSYKKFWGHVDRRGPSLAEFHAEPFYEIWMGFIDNDNGDGCPVRRNLAAMIRKLLKEAHTKYETGELPGVRLLE